MESQPQNPEFRNNPENFLPCNMYAFTSKFENSVDPNQLASQKPADLDLHCFQNRVYMMMEGSNS